MPSSPKILKETILETAYSILIRDGYGSINIKNLAKELGCSTQPISRQFGSMEGLRDALLDYCLVKFAKAFTIKSEHVADIVLGVAQGYIDLAYDFPNVYKYLYMSEQDGEKMSNMAHSQRAAHYGKVIEMLELEYEITTEKAFDFMRNMEYYVHGIASYIATEYIKDDKEDVMKRIESVRDIFLTLAQSR